MAENILNLSQRCGCCIVPWYFVSALVFVCLQKTFRFLKEKKKELGDGMKERGEKKKEKRKIERHQ